MRKLIFAGTFTFLILFFITATIHGQVKIGGNPKENPHPSSLLELQSSDKGFLLPRMTDKEMQAIKEPADALLIFNTDAKTVYIFSAAQKQWVPMQQTAPASLLGDSCEWVYDTATGRINLVRGLPLGDSIYYHTTKRKFVFSDKRTFGNTSIPLDEQFPGKYYFKGTASRLFNDSSSVSFPSLTLSNFLYEVDNDSFAIANPGIAFYNGMRISTQMLPTATQRASTIRTMNLQLNHTGADSLNSVNSVVSNSFIDGRGYTGSFTGFQNNMAITDSARNNVGTIFGYRNLISMSGNGGGRVTGNVFGYNGSISGFTDSLGNRLVNGNAYGVFLNSINVAAPKRNYAFYANKGHNRFGDSTLITDGNFTSPRAVLDVNSTSAMITPAGTSVQRPAVPVAAMLRFNSDNSNMEFYNGSAWKGFSSDTSEWKFDAGSNQVNLSRGLALGDSVYYNTTRRKFVFADKRTFGNTSVPLDEQFPGKYYFKATASKLYNDAASVSFPSLTLANFLYEVDNDSFAIVNPGIAFYNGMRISTQLLPTATQRASTIRTMNLQLNHTGADSLNSVNSVVSNSFIDGRGYTGVFTGYQNNMSITDSATNNVGTIYGFRNLISMSGNGGGRVTGNVFGYNGSISGFTDALGNKLVNGNAYGIFLNNINVAAPKRNYAFYANKGHNRFGDSTLITDGASTSPRAVLDVNATSAMIVPTGTTAQRPATAVSGMIRFNTDNGGRIESYNGASWTGIIRSSAAIDPPNIPVNSGATVSVAFTGAATGNVVSISPSAAPPAGIIIAWARVSAANTIEVRFENNSAAAINPASATYNIRIIQ